MLLRPLNQVGDFVMVAEKVGQETTLSRIMQMVKEAQHSRAPIQGLADKVSAYYVPMVLVVSLLTFVAWLLWGPEPRLAFALVNSVAVLIIACPCAIGLATPVPIVVGIGRAAQQGILIKSAEAMQKLESIDTLVVDRAVADPIKASTAEALKILTEAGIKIIMLTGDNAGAAPSVARPLGLADVEAEATPEGKLAYVRKLQGQGRKVAMAGNGVNDALAIAQADVGIAMESGTDITLESADLTLLKGDLRGLARALKLSRATMGNIRQNLFLAFIYNFLGVPVAAGVLYPSFGILLSPMLASVTMTLSSLSVVLNALRLRQFAPAGQ